jgi:hemerythrin-like metal-binding protein
MALLNWREEFAIGIDDVDHEHRALIALINRLHEDLVQHRSGPQVAAFLGEVHAQIAAHFALEEKLMRQLRYAEFTAHKVDHEILLDEIRDIMDAQDRGSAEASPDVLGGRLADWFGLHFRTHDARFHKSLGHGR